MVPAAPALHQDPLTIGFVGYAKKAKGFDSFIHLAGAADASNASWCRFNLVGQVADPAYEGNLGSIHVVPNVVRREALFTELKTLGANVCLIDGPDLPSQVSSAVGGAPIRLALDAVAAQATQRLAASVADGGTVCNYGAMTEAEVTLAHSDLIFRGVSVVGFMLGRALARRSLAEVRALYAEIAGQVCADGLQARVLYVENIANPRFERWLRQAGFRRCPHGGASEFSSYYLVR